MKGVIATAVYVAATTILLSSALIAAPARDLSSVSNGGAPAPVLQWFEHIVTGALTTSQKEFYDNVGFALPYYFGGPASWHAVRGVVTDVNLDPLGAITGFTVRASITNDLYDYPDVMPGTYALNDHRQNAAHLSGSAAEGMRNVRFTASFADDGVPGNLPGVAPFRPESNIYAIDYEWLGWFCYHWGELPPLGSYWVPAWNFTGDGRVRCTGGTPDVILPGETHTRELRFGCYMPIGSSHPDYQTIMSSLQFGTELFLNRTRSLKISNYPDVLSTDSGAPFPEYPPVYNSDVSVFYDPEPTQTKWQQPPDPETITPPGVYHGWNEPSDWWEGPIAADDWVCTGNDPITAVRWWGSFRGWTRTRPPQLPNHFHIQFWSNVPAGPQEPFAHPGTVIHEVRVERYQCRFAGWDYDPKTASIEACFEFSCEFNPADYFFQETAAGEPGVYWISIAPCEEGAGTLPYPWGWKTRPRQGGPQPTSAAVSITEPLRPSPGSTYVSGHQIYWPTQQETWDLAFQLTARSTLESAKWNQPPEPGAAIGTYKGWDEKSVYRSNQIASDDWLCTSDSPVSVIRWWGSYRYWQQVSPPPDAPPVFHLAVWTNDSSGGQPPSHPGQVIKHWWVTRDQLNETFVGYGVYPGYTSDSCFSYEFRIPRGEWFYQKPGPITTRFWLSIAAVYDWPQFPEHQWGWLTRPYTAWGEAVAIFDPTAPGPGSVYLRGAPIRDPLGNRMDLSFDLASVWFGELYIKWSQPPIAYESTYFRCWDELSVYGSSQIAADDWVCLGKRPVTDLQWWGSFEGWSKEQLPPRIPDGFHITVWTDVPINGGYSHPGEVIWQTYCENYEAEFAGWILDPRFDTPPKACFRFHKRLTPDQWFSQDTVSGIYWISIAAVYTDSPPQENRWGWTTRPRLDSLAPDAAVRIFDPTAPWPGSHYIQGEPIIWPANTDNRWDLSFVLGTYPSEPGSLTFTKTAEVPDHFWYPGAAEQNVMLRLTVSADPREDVTWDSVTLQAYGSGNDATDISAVNVWLDNNHNGKADPADTWIGTGQFPNDDGTLTISIGVLPPPVAPVVIPPGSSIDVLITYVMAGNPATGSWFRFDVTGAAGTGVASGYPASIAGLPIASCKKVVGVPPMTIGQAKLADIGDTVLLENKVLTADFTRRMGLFYIEEQDRSAGIAVVVLPSDESPAPSVSVGDHVSVLGKTVMLYGSDPTIGTEAAILPQQVLFAPGEPIAPVGTMNRSSGGADFGVQPGVIDDASDLIAPKRSYGLNSIGMLVRLWGRVTGYNPNLQLPWGNGQVFWIDDGTLLRDGFNPAGDIVTGVAVLMPQPLMQPSGYWGITGILKAIPNPSGLPVRLLVPRDLTDMQLFAEPE